MKVIHSSGKDHLTKWFLKCLCTFVSIILISMLLSMAIYKNSYDTNMSTVRSAYEHILKSAYENFLSSVTRAQNSAQYIANNQAVQKLSRANKKTLKANTQDLITLKYLITQDRLINGDEFPFEVLMYTDNDYIATGHTVSNDFRKEYGLALSVDGLSGQAWREQIFEAAQAQKMTFLPLQKIRSDYFYSSNPVEVLPIVIPLFNTRHNSIHAVFVYYFDISRVTDMLSELIKNDAVIYSVVNAEGSLLIGSSVTANSCDDIVLTANSELLPGYVFTAALNNEFMLGETDNLTRIIRIYIYAALLGMLILSIYYALRRTRLFNALASIDANEAIKPAQYSSPYIYLSDILKNASYTRTALSQRLILTESIFITTLLQNTCVRGLAGKDDLDRCREVLGSKYSSYCIIVFRLFEKYEYSIDPVNIESSFEREYEPQVLMTPARETVYIVPLTRPTDYEGIVRDSAAAFSKYGLVGISSVSNSIDKLHAVYMEAYSMLTRCTEASTVCVFTSEDRSAHPDAVSVSFEQLNALRNSIMAGNAQEVEQFFENLIESPEPAGIERLQLLFTFRQLLVRLAQPNIDEQTASDKLTFLLDESYETCICRLKDFAVRITQNTQKLTGPNVRTVNNIMQIIEKDFTDSNMCAEYIADKLHFSAKYIYKLIRDNTGQTVGDIIEKTRLKFSLDFLTSTDKTNDEIAQICGFVSLNTFYRAFRKVYGVTPGEYRKLHQNSLS